MTAWNRKLNGWLRKPFLWLGTFVVLSVYLNLAWLTGELKEREKLSALRFTEDFAASVRAQFFERYSDSQALALNPYLIEVLKGDEAAKIHASKVLEEFIRLYQVYTAVVLSDLQGNLILYSSVSPDFEVGKFLAFPFRNLRIGTEFAKLPFSSNIQVAGASGPKLSQFQFFRSPVLGDHGEVLGWIHNVASSLYLDREFERALGQNPWQTTAGWELILNNAQGKRFASLRNSEIEYAVKSVDLNSPFSQGTWEHFFADIRDARLQESLPWSAELRVRSSLIFAHSNRLNWILWITNAFVIIAGASALVFIQRNEAKEKQRVTELVLAAQENEKSRISREIHDEVGQSMSAAKIWLSKAKTAAEHSGNSGLLEPLNYVQTLIEETNDSLRSISLSLHPSLVQNLGLLEAAEWRLKSMCEASSVQWKMINKLGPIFDSLDSAQQMHIYRFMQEAVNNVIKHSRADQVVVYINAEGDRVFIQVVDNGKGISELSSGIGFYSMEERATALGGQLVWHSPVSAALKAELGLLGRGPGLRLTLNLPGKLFNKGKGRNFVAGGEYGNEKTIDR